MRLAAASFLTLLATAAVCQEGKPEGVDIDFSKGPSLHLPAGSTVVPVYPAFKDYTFMIFDICDALGLTISSGDCHIYTYNASLGGKSVAATVDGKKMIVYDREISSRVGYEGVVMVLAHQLGHHYCGHLGSELDSGREVQADAFAGAAAKLRGYELDVALSAVAIFDEPSSPSDPGRAARIRAVTAGWNDPESGKTCKLP